MSPGTKPLAGLRVADFCWLIAGPAATRLFAEFGAEVIKIESEARDDQIRIAGLWPVARTEATPNAVFADCNANKLSVTLNLNHSRGIELAKEIVRRSDIVTNNFTGERMDRWGLGYADLKKIKPDIIMLTMPVMGTTGPFRHYGANGNGVMAYGGLTASMGFPGRPPAGMGTLYSDFTTPYFAVTTLLAAVHHREVTGEGQFIDLSQVQATVSLLGTDILEYSATGEVRKPNGNRSPNYCPHGCYPCLGEDRWCVIAVREEEEWRALCEAMGRPDLGVEERLATPEGRRRHEDELDAVLAGWTRERDAWEIAEVLQRSGVMAAVVENVEDLLINDQLMRAEHFVDVRSGDGAATYTLHRQPIRIDSLTPTPVLASQMGQHNEYVFKELLGIDEEEYVQILVDGVIR